MSNTSESPARRQSAVMDRELRARSGVLVSGLIVALFAVSGWFAYHEWLTSAVVGIAIDVFLAIGLVTLQPNESLVCLLFGNYVGTEHWSGFWWVNPLNSRIKVSRRLETLECGPLKVNDAVGNPVDISAVLVWRVEDAAKALLEVGSYTKYVTAQSETAVRHVANDHPYDQVEVAEAAARETEPASPVQGNGETPQRAISAVTLRDGGDAIIRALLEELKTRMEPIGVVVIEARISHLAYSSEIAGAMLRKQAASAVVAARRLVVTGAVSIVEEALKQLEQKDIAGALDAERKAAMISNLLVVLVGEREVSPVINAGTLYS